MLNLETCKFVVWGFKNTYNTFGHIHEAFYRALKFMRRDVQWLDHLDDISSVDFSNTFFISMEQGVVGMPRRQDCFYALHNMEQQSREITSGLAFLNYGLHTDTTENPSNLVELAADTFFLPPTGLRFRWGTDLLPEEIHANKPVRVFRSESRESHFIGSNVPELLPFANACRSNGISFEHQSNVSIEDNIRLIQKSYIAPAINVRYQTEVGYIPCRIFKNISYGQMGVTNSKAVNDFFRGRLIYNPDPEKLFYQAQEQLPEVSLDILHQLMDEVAEKHTYLNKIDALLKAAKMVQEQS